MLAGFRNLFTLIILTLILSTINGNGQDYAQPSTYKILGINVTGCETADPATIIANTGLKIGGEIAIPGEQTRDAIRRLYNLKMFEDIQIFVENKIHDGVFLLIKVKENPRLDTIIITGNDEMDVEDILKKVNLVKGQIVSSQDLYNIVRVLKHDYDEEGYLNAKVTPSFVRINDTVNRVVLKIDIDEGSKVVVDNIRFHGNKKFSDSDLKGEMEDTKERKWWKFWLSNKFDRKKYRQDKDKVIAYYRKNGFKDAEILYDSLRFDERRKYLTIDIFVNEGPQYFIRNISWEGNKVYSSNILTERLGFRKGDVYDQERFEQNLRRNEEETDVTSLYADNGYLMFQVQPEMKVVEGDSLDINLKVYEGNQFRIGRVFITGNTKTYEKVIRRELLTKPGDYFSRQLIIRSLRQLMQLNYFNPEKLKPDVRIVDDKTVDLEYSVEEKSSDSFNMSVGYSGAYGFSGGIGITLNNFSLSEPWRGGAGQVLSLDYQFGVSAYYRTFAISFMEPWMFNTPTSFGFSIFDTYQYYYADLHNRGMTLRLGRRFKWPDIYFRGDWIFRVQENTYHSLSSYYYDYRYPEGKTTQIGITQIISRNSTDSPIFPSRGSSISLTTEVNGGPKFGGALDAARFHKHIFNIDWYIPLSSSGKIALMSSNTIGVIFGFERNSYIPWQDLFYMGGTGLGQFSVTPLRGYEENSIGPYGGNIGGKAMMKFTAELRFSLTIHPIPIYTLLFAEAGNVWKDHSVMNYLDLFRSAGLGIRLMINPLGLVGFDYGYGFDSAVPGGAPSGWKFHFQFGKTF